MNPEDILSAINRISSNTVEQLEQFSNFEWEAPSRCHMWANKDVAAHLVATLGFNLNSITMALSGNHLPVEGMPNPGTFHSSEIAPGIASRAIQLSETSLRNKTTLLKVLSDIQQDFNDTCKTINESKWELKAYHPVNMLSIAEILLIVLLELTLHTWDIFNALQDDYVVDEKSAILLVNLWKNSNANSWFIVNPSGDSPDVTPKVIDIDLGLENKLRLTTYKGNLDIFEKSDAMDLAPTTIQTSPTDFSLLITARKNLFDLIEQKRVTVEGNKKNLLMFHHWFKGT